MALIEVKVPDIGDFKDVAVIELLVKPGDRVQLEQSLVTVESDKASMEIPVVGGGRGQGAEGQDRRHGQRRFAAAAAGRRGRGRCRRAGDRPRGTTGCRTGRGRGTGGQLCRRCRPGMRHARARRRAGRLFGRLPRRRPGPEGGAGRTLCLARRGVPERRLHPQQGAAARGRGDGRGQALRRPGRQLRRADGRQLPSCWPTRTRWWASSPAACARWPRCAR